MLLLYEVHVPQPRVFSTTDFTVSVCFVSLFEMVASWERAVQTCDIWCRFSYQNLRSVLSGYNVAMGPRRLHADSNYSDRSLFRRSGCSC